MNKPITIGAKANVDFPMEELKRVPARIDTGAKTSSIWASGIEERAGKLSFYLFDKQNKYYTDKRHTTASYVIKQIRSTSGHIEKRYTIKLRATIEGLHFYSSFTLANRQLQQYPILIGRNIIRGNFIIDLSRKQLLKISKDQT